MFFFLPKRFKTKGGNFKEILAKYFFNKTSGINCNQEMNLFRLGSFPVVIWIESFKTNSIKFE